MAYTGPERRTIPRLSGTGRAYVTTWGVGPDVQAVGITDGKETVEFGNSTEAILAARLHNLIHHHEEEA